MKADREDVWHTALGPDSDDLIADLRDRYRDRLDGVRAMSELRARAMRCAFTPDGLSFRRAGVPAYAAGARTKLRMAACDFSQPERDAGPF